MHLKHSLRFESIPIFCPIASTAAVIDIKHCKSSGCEELFFKVQGR